MKKAFKHPQLQSQYEMCRQLGNDTSSGFYRDGRPRRGAGHRDAYWNGRHGNPSRYIKDSLSYASWAAGRDDRKLDVKAFNVVPGPYMQGSQLVEPLWTPTVHQL